MNTSETSGSNPTPRRKAHSGTPMVNPPLTPLIDVFLFLIIFFLLGCKFMQFEGAIPANLPKTVPGGEGDLIVAMDPIRVSLAPAADGAVRIRVGGIVRPHDVADMAGLYQTLSDFRSKFGGAPGDPGRPVYIHATPGVRWGAAADAFNQAVRAGYRHVGFIPSGAQAI